MVGSGHENHFVGVHVDPLQLVKRRLVLDEAYVDFAVHHLARNLCEPAAIDADLDIGESREVRRGAAQAADRRPPIRARRCSACLT